jgi:hypothetical protein
MLLTKEVYKNAFIQAVKANDLNIYFQKNNHFILIKGDDSSKIVAVELICSIKIDIEAHGSRNNNTINGIGHFNFNIPKWEDKINFYVFALLDSVERNIEFVIIPDEVLRSRFQNQNRIPVGGKKAELTLWLMPCRKVYDATNISMESEWYFINGNMAEGGEMDYSSYLNNWTGLVDSFSE